MIREKTPLHLAIEQELLELAQLLIEKGADMKVKSGSGIFPLSLASEDGQLELVQMLIKSGVGCGYKYSKYRRGNPASLCR